MLPVKISTKVRGINQYCSIIDIQGEVNRFAEKHLMDAYKQASQQAQVVIFNFSELDYMNSSGIGLLVTLLVHAQKEQKTILAFGLKEHYRHIFELTRLNEAIKTFENESEAVAEADQIQQS